MKQKGWHALSIDDALNQFHTTKEGLNTTQVNKQTESFGQNELPREQVAAWWIVLARQFVGPMVLVLVVAALLSAVLQEWVDTAVIVAAVLLNTVIGFIQENKANRSLEQLRNLVQPKAIVRREGKEQEILAREIVPGDLLVLSTGDQVTADARLIEVVDLDVNEAALTGESLPIKKNLAALGVGTVLAERENMVYAGTHVVGGRGIAIVIATGLQTEIGKIASLVKEAKEGVTPLQAQLKQLARWLATFIIGAIAVLFVVGLLADHEWFEMVELGIALAVAAIPEGLLLSVTVVLAIGMQRILKRKSLVRKLVAAETLGSVSVICSDKTGTITEGEMRVVEIVAGKEVCRVEKGEVLKGVCKEILAMCVVCNDVVATKKKGAWEFRGSPTERALMLAGTEQKIDPKKIRKDYERFAEIPFDSAHKYMVTLNTWEKEQRMILKGAPEKVLAFSGKMFVDGKVQPLTAARKGKLEAQAAQLTEQGLRLIAVGYKTATKKTVLKKGALKEFVFLGFVGLRDPLRKDARKQIERARAAGVRTVIITGDHPKTARAIGKEAGVLTNEKGVVTGDELDKWSDTALMKKVENIHIYARVEPRHKIRIVNAWKARGEVVAMTGDGVNDAPALKASDIGVALGSGTEVAKQSSDIVLLNNDLATITAAIEQGRVIFDNIRKIVIYLLTSSFTEIVLVGGAILIGLPTPLLAVHILWINIVQDSFPSMALTMDPGEKDILLRPPRPRDEPVLNKEALTIIFAVGLLSDLVLFGIFIWYLSMGDLALARTLMFVAVGLNALLYIFAVRSLHQSVFKMNPFSNQWLLASVAFGFGFMLLALLFPPIRDAFELTALTLSDWGILLMIGLVKVFAIELVKLYFNYKTKKADLLSV
jgi:P-type Ca2+ transporter type 2C